MSRDVPLGWEVSKLRDLATHVTDKWEPGDDGPHRYLGLEHIDQGTGKILEVGSSDGLSSLKIKFRLGDVLFGKLRPNLRKTALPDFDGIASTDIIALRAKGSVDPTFLFYTASSDPCMNHAVRSAAGTKMPRTSWALLGDFEVALPPLEEQRRIAEILSSVDEAIQTTQAVIEQTRAVNESVLQRLLTKGFDHSRFKETEIGAVPEEWEVKTVHEAGAFVLDGDRGATYPKQSDYSDSGFCLFLSAQNVTKSGFRFDHCQFITEEKHKALRSGTLERGDVVVTTRGTVGNVALVESNVPFDVMRVNSGMAIIRLNKAELDSRFFYALMNSKIVNSQLSRLVFGSAQPQLTLGIIRNLLIPVPPRDEQIQIARSVSVLNEQHISGRRYLAQLKLVKSELASALLTGRTRVPAHLPLAAE